MTQRAAQRKLGYSSFDLAIVKEFPFYNNYVPPDHSKIILHRHVIKVLKYKSLAVIII